MHLFHKLLSFDFCYDLDFWAQGQGFRVFLSLKCVLPLFGQNFVGYLDQISESFIDRWHMMLLLIFS